MATHCDARRGDWHRQPVVWLGAVIFVASLAGCVWMIVLGARHADEPVPSGTTVFKVPTATPPPAPPKPSQ